MLIKYIIIIYNGLIEYNDAIEYNDVIEYICTTITSFRIKDMSDIVEWYEQLKLAKNHLIAKDPKLKIVFETVDKEAFQLHTVIKDPYTALIGAIIGQKISYKTAKSLRGKLYSKYGNLLVPCEIIGADLYFLGTVPSNIIKSVTNYILDNNIDMNTENGIRSLINVNGIGSWTIETTLLTCLMNWDLFPMGDKFLQVRMNRLYGRGCDIQIISANWAPYRSIVTWYLWRWF